MSAFPPTFPSIPPATPRPIGRVRPIVLRKLGRAAQNANLYHVHFLLVFFCRCNPCLAYLFWRNETYGSAPLSCPTIFSWWRLKMTSSFHYPCRAIVVSARSRYILSSESSLWSFLFATLRCLVVSVNNLSLYAKLYVLLYDLYSSIGVLLFHSVGWGLSLYVEYMPFPRCIFSCLSVTI